MKTKTSLASALFLIVLVATAGAQAQGGQFHGFVTGPFDGLVADAPMRVMHVASGDSWQTRTDAGGRYQFGGLPAGDYRLQVRLPCREFVSEPA